MNRYDPEMLIRAANPGEAMAALLRPTCPGNVPDSVLLLRTQAAELRALPPQPPIAVRAGLLRCPPVWVMPILVKIRYTVYLALYNHCGCEGPVFLTNLCGQPDMLIWVYPAASRAVRRFASRSTLHRFWQEAYRLLDDTPAWTPAEWEWAVETFFASFSREELWASLGRHKE